jgi:hypothetical protein
MVQPTGHAPRAPDVPAIDVTFSFNKASNGAARPNRPSRMVGRAFGYGKLVEAPSYAGLASLIDGHFPGESRFKSTRAASQNHWRAYFEMGVIPLARLNLIRKGSLGRPLRNVQCHNGAARRFFE